jgi:cytidine deaminase
MKLTIKHWAQLEKAAWRARRHAYLYAKTKVGAAVMTSDGKIFPGCNVEHRFRSHDIHAEVNAISNMVAAGKRKLVAVIIVANRKSFTPCGACMDWIMEFGGADCKVAFRSRTGKATIYTASELMPFYPS